jgi:hypothetical protein
MQFGVFLNSPYLHLGQQPHELHQAQLGQTDTHTHIYNKGNVMPIQSVNPIIVDDVEYPYYTVNLAISPLVKDTEVGASVAMRLTPYRETEEGKTDVLQGHDRPVVYLDVFASEDMPAENAAYNILGIIQQFIVEKGL